MKAHGTMGPELRALVQLRPHEQECTSSLVEKMSNKTKPLCSDPNCETPAKRAISTGPSEATGTTTSHVHEYVHYVVAVTLSAPVAPYASGGFNGVNCVFTGEKKFSP